MKVNANVILAKCYSKQIYGMRVQAFNLEGKTDWLRTWAFPIKENDAAGENFDSVEINGSLLALDEYPGCPYCGESNFIRCGRCHKISCYKGEEMSVCHWCGNASRVTHMARFDLSGGGY